MCERPQSRAGNTTVDKALRVLALTEFAIKEEKQTFSKSFKKYVYITIGTVLRNKNAAAF